MAEVIIMPKLGFNMDEGQLIKWHKDVGDYIVKGEILFEINTDKTNIGVEATEDGTVLKILLQEGEFAPVFQPIAVIGKEGDNPETILEEEGHVYTKTTERKEATEITEKRETLKQKESEQDNEYEITVIGSGPGGYVAAIKAAQMGKKVCIIEEKDLGGVCLNEGCIPTKTLIKTVNLYEGIKHAANFGIEGIDLSKVSISMAKLQTRKEKIIKQLVDGVQGLLYNNKVSIMNGTASFIDKNTVKVGDETITSDYFIIATGSESFKPSFIEYEGNTNIITSKGALKLNDIPESIAIIGGGVIGIEFAYILSILGAKVTVLELMDNILPMVDEEVANIARRKLEEQGINFHTGAKVKRISDGQVIYEEDYEDKKVTVDTVLMAVGRVPSTEGLNPESVGIEFDGKAIKTDLTLQTNIPNIYAIGDVNGKSMLAHTASHEGIIAVNNICGYQSTINYDFVPSCIYLEPEIACVGLTESEAREKYDNVKVGKFPMLANGKSLVEGDTDGMIKVILEGEFNEILGVHILAKHATDMISEVTVAMNLESTAEEIIQSIHPHPTVAEGVPEAFMAALTGKAIHFI